MKRPHVHVAADGAAESIQGATTCCHGKSAKSRIADPQGIVRETFPASGESAEHGESAEQGDSPDPARLGRDVGCCTPQTRNGECCPPKADLAADAPCCGTRLAPPA